MQSSGVARCRASLCEGVGLPHAVPLGVEKWGLQPPGVGEQGVQTCEPFFHVVCCFSLSGFKRSSAALALGPVSSSFGIMGLSDSEDVNNSPSCCQDGLYSSQYLYLNLTSSLCKVLIVPCKWTNNVFCLFFVSLSLPSGLIDL
jgi:hypothetical protein